jgi:uncharacterized protein YijF (DUF1287 family)
MLLSTDNIVDGIMRSLLALWLALLFVSNAYAEGPGACLIRKAREQIGVTVHYDPAYRRLSFPGGDVAPDRGVCTDVLIRAYRRLDVDLQELVNRDMRSAWAAYPKLWGMSRPDTNIDHRRVPNLATFFTRHGSKLPASADASAYQAGDIVTWLLTAGVPHIGIVSDRRSPSGVPLVIHNIGRGTLEEDMLFRYQITGHYRYEPAALSQACADP